MPTTPPNHCCLPGLWELKCLGILDIGWGSQSRPVRARRERQGCLSHTGCRWLPSEEPLPGILNQVREEGGESNWQSTGYLEPERLPGRKSTFAVKSFSKNHNLWEHSKDKIWNNGRRGKIFTSSGTNSTNVSNNTWARQKLCKSSLVRSYLVPKHSWFYLVLSCLFKACGFSYICSWFHVLLVLLQHF